MIFFFIFNVVVIIKVTQLSFRLTLTPSTRRGLAATCKSESRYPAACQPHLTYKRRLMVGVRTMLRVGCFHKIGPNVYNLPCGMRNRLVHHHAEGRHYVPEEKSGTQKTGDSDTSDMYSDELKTNVDSESGSDTDESSAYDVDMEDAEGQEKYDIDAGPVTSEVDEGYDADREDDDSEWE